MRLEDFIIKHLDNIEFIVGAVAAIGISYLIAYDAYKNEKRERDKYGR